MRRLFIGKRFVYDLGCLSALPQLATRHYSGSSSVTGRLHQPFSLVLGLRQLDATASKEHNHVCPPEPTLINRSSAVCFEMSKPRPFFSTSASYPSHSAEMHARSSRSSYPSFNYAAGMPILLLTCLVT